MILRNETGTQLLIEPIWNRNLYAYQIGLQIIQLLIEPIWNRNMPGSRAETTDSMTFNRTNME